VPRVPAFSFSGGTTLPTFTSLINQTDPYVRGNSALVSAEGVFSFGSKSLARVVQPRVVLGGAETALESCSAGFALLRGVEQTSALYLARLIPAYGVRSRDIGGYSYVAIADPFTQDIVAPVAISSFTDGPVVMCAAGACQLIFALSVPKVPPLSFASQDFGPGVQFAQPQLLGSDYFAVLALETGESVGVAIHVYQIVGASLTPVARVPLSHAARLEDVTSYAFSTGTSPADPYDSAAVSLANYSYISQPAGAPVRTLYAGETKVSDVGPNTVLGRGLIFTDYVCL
jgi:hypothetical protein